MDSEHTQPGFGDYFQAAFVNQYNLILSGGLLAFGLMSGSLPIVIPIWMGVEMLAIWQIATHPGFQRKVQLHWEQRAKAALERQSLLDQEKLIHQIPAQTKQRFLALKDCYQEISQAADSMAESNVGVSVWQAEIEKLSYVLQSFLRLAHFQSNLDQLLASTNKDAMRINIKSVKLKMQNCSDNLRFQYQKYLDVLQQRLDKTEKAAEISEAIRVQLNIIEEQFRLMQQQMLLVKNPQQLTDQLDFLVQGINDLEDQGTMILSLQAELAQLTPAPPDLT